MSDSDFQFQELLRQRLEAMTDELGEKLSYLDTDTLFDKIIDQKNATIAELKAQFQELNALNQNAATQTPAGNVADLNKKLSNAMSKLRVLRDEIDSFYKPILDRNKITIAQLNAELSRKWKAARVAARLPELDQADAARSYLSFSNWTLSGSVLEAEAWFIASSEVKGIVNEASPADLLFESTANSTHGISRLIESIQGHLPFRVSALIRPHGREFAALWVLSKNVGDHIAEGYFDLAMAAPIRPRAVGAFANVELAATPIVGDWTQCQMSFDLKEPLEQLTVWVLLRRDRTRASKYPGDDRAAIGLAEVQVGYRRTT